MASLRLRPAHSVADTWQATAALESRVAKLEGSAGLLHVTHDSDACTVTCMGRGASLMLTHESAAATSSDGGRRALAIGSAMVHERGSESDNKLSPSVGEHGGGGSGGSKGSGGGGNSEHTKNPLLEEALRALEHSRAKAAESEAKAAAATRRLAASEAEVAALAKQMAQLLIEKNALLDACGSGGNQGL